MERPTKSSPTPSRQLLTPMNSALVLIDFQPQMFFGVGSHDRQLLINNTVALAKASNLFEVPTILSTVETKAFSGPFLSEIQGACPDNPPIERSSMNAWEDAAFVKAVERTGRPKLVMAALWTDVCLVFPVLSALEQGYEVYIVVDASGGTTEEAHQTAITRMTQAGAIPVTWLAVTLEWQRDWARKETYEAVVKLIREHGGAYGQGIEYAQTMLGAGNGNSGKKEKRPRVSTRPQ